MIKLLVIAFIALVLLVPMGMIKEKIHEREFYRQSAADSIANSWTGD